ncbi:MAG: DsrE/DsrF/DrsH-like family protein [Firmicutes bacterium]|uniref:Peroxiredoxin family protein n=1 Tax=Melghirimyces thermohalophilus TaxID=1236220 RepID=A0A1G6L9J4_9BACL|nr:DsrE/DsrF/DrsH-like family protein [Melghirimyces thermohalophilus]MDA8352416.1 DsrE/DsrF/DrsH-like family protein [Bacillota bacterium]SDC39960.1 Peroxiredoxin family protein [Melghirimyces thermohalophilus]
MAKKVAIIAANGDLATAYKTMNIATAGAASDAEVGIFFTFEGLNIIHREGHQQLSMGPGKEHMAEGFKKAGVPSIGELLDIARESGVKLIGCQMTMDAMGIDKNQLIDGVEVGGAASFLDFAYDADITLSF